MKSSRNQGLDTLKALSISFVLFWHLHPIKFVYKNASEQMITSLNSLVSNFEYQLTLTAVPIFYIVSLYLFIIKNFQSDLNYLKNRLNRLLQIFLFWTFIHVTLYWIYTSKLPALTWTILLGISPKIPLVGDSVFYFILNLIILTIITHFYQHSNKKLRLVLSIAIVTITLLGYEISYLSKVKIPYFFIGNFLIYIPIAFALVNHQNQVLKFKFFYLGAYLLFSLHDIILRTYGFPTTVYGRVSIFFGALTFFCFIYNANFKTNRLINFLAKYSLGLFALHKYWQYIFILISKNYLFKINLGIPVNILSLSSSLLALGFTIITIIFLRKTKLKLFIA